MTRAIVIPLALLAMLAAAAPAVAAPARLSITAGHAPTRAYPYMAYVAVAKQAGPFSCGGTLIASRWVLTAGHCVADPATSTNPVGRANVRVVLGKRDLRTTRESDVRAVNTVRLHPSYSATPQFAHYDVALLQLASRTSAAPARLPRPGDGALWAPGTVATAIGYGKTAASDSQPSALLLETELAVRPDSECRLPGIAINTALAVCAANGDARGVCQGDSGGPMLVAGDTVAGVVSSSSHSCNGSFQAFARAGNDPINAWIRSIVPQAEIDVAPAAPQPGDHVTLTSASRRPGGAFTSLRWDLDGDGGYDDATGPSATFPPLPAGQRVVGLQAADDSGQRETRRILLDVRPRTPVELTGPGRVREGRAVRLTLTTPGTGTGTVSLQAAPVGRPVAFDPMPFAAPVAFAAGQQSQSVVVKTRDNWRRRGRRRLRVAVAGASGQLIVGARALRTVTVLDDDIVTPKARRSLRVRRGRVAVPVKVHRRGRVRFAIIRRRAGRRPQRLASATARFRRKGSATVRIRLRRAGRRFARRSPGTTVHLTAGRRGDRLGPPLARRLR